MNVSSRTTQLWQGRVNLPPMGQKWSKSEHQKKVLVEPTKSSMERVDDTSISTEEEQPVTHVTARIDERTAAPLTEEEISSAQNMVLLYQLAMVGNEYYV